MHWRSWQLNFVFMTSHMKTWVNCCSQSRTLWRVNIFRLVIWKSLCLICLTPEAKMNVFFDREEIFIWHQFEEILFLCMWLLFSSSIWKSQIIIIFIDYVLNFSLHPRCYLISGCRSHKTWITDSHLLFPKLKLCRVLWNSELLNHRVIDCALILYSSSIVIIVIHFYLFSVQDVKIFTFFLLGLLEKFHVTVRIWYYFFFNFFFLYRSLLR